MSAYQAAPFEENLIRTGIQRRESAPHEHQQNRQVERYVRSMEEQVTSMRAAAPWVPKKFITQQILLWALIWNLQSGVHIHKSRVEQFTGRRPSINLNDLPGAWGDFRCSWAQKMFIASVCPSVCLSICPSVHLSVCPSVRLSVCPSVCLSVSETKIWSIENKI